MQVLHAERRHPAQPARRNQLMRLHSGRKEAVVERHLRAHARRARRLGNAPGARVAYGHGLVYVHMLARRNRGQRHLLVQLIGRAYGHHVYLRVAEQPAIVVGSVAKALLLRRALRLLQSARAYAHQARRKVQLVMQRHGLYRKGMRAAHESPADHAYPDTFHTNPPKTNALALRRIKKTSSAGAQTSARPRLVKRIPAIRWRGASSTCGPPPTCCR